MPTIDQMIAETQAEFSAPPPAQQTGAQQPPAAGGMDALIAETQQEIVEKPKRRQDALSLTENFVVGLNKLQPEKQAEFLREQGFDAFLEGGKVRVDRGQGSEDFDADGLDAGDVARWFPEILIGGIEAVATGSKVLGAIAAPATGGASLAAGMAIGGAAGAVGEAAIQTGAKLAGVRDEFDIGEIGKQGVIGATIPGVFGLGTKAVKAGAKALQAAPGQRQAVQEAAETIGAEATPGQLTDSPLLQGFESLQAKQPAMLGGRGLRKQIKSNQEAVARTAEEILAGKSGRSALEVGAEVRAKITESMEKKLGKAEDLYAEVLTSTKLVPAVTDKLESGIEKIAADMRFSTDGEAFLNRVRNKLGTVENVEDLRMLRTSIMDEVPPTAAKNVKITADRLYGLLTKARSDSYRSAVKELKRVGAPGSEEGLKGLIKKLDEADRLYAETAKEATNALLGKGKHLKGGVKRGAKRAIEGVPDEKLASRLLPRGDLARAQALKKLSPEAFESAKSQIIEDIAQKATPTAQGTIDQGFNSKTIFKEIDKMGPEMAEMIFGKDGVKKAEALKTFYKSIPRDVNPSGTATAMNEIKFLSPLRQAESLSLSALRALVGSREAIGRGVAKAAGSKKVQKTGLAAAFQAGQQTRGPKQEDK